MNAKDFAAEWKWMNSSPEPKKRSNAAKAQAFSEFRKHFPRADISKFQARVDFDSDRKATGRVLFPDGDGSWEKPLTEDRKYWSQPLKDALGIHQDGGFPMQLTLLKRTKQTQMPIQGLVKKKPTQTAATATPATQTQTPVTDTPATQTQTQTTTKEDSDDTHHINKALVGLGALALVGFVFWASK